MIYNNIITKEIVVEKNHVTELLPPINYLTLW